jgi:hypothetical protein
VIWIGGLSISVISCARDDLSGVESPFVGLAYEDGIDPDPSLSDVSG